MSPSARSQIQRGTSIPAAGANQPRSFDTGCVWRDDSWDTVRYTLAGCSFGCAIGYHLALDASVAPSENF
jgi:hypothetical protein